MSILCVFVENNDGTYLLLCRISCVLIDLHAKNPSLNFLYCSKENFVLLQFPVIFLSSKKMSFCLNIKWNFFTCLMVLHFTENRALDSFKDTANKKYKPRGSAHCLSFQSEHAAEED